MSNEDFLYFLNKQIEQGIIVKSELILEFETAIKNDQFDWVKTAIENGLFKEFEFNPIKSKTISNQILLKTVDSIYWDDIFQEKPKQNELNSFKSKLKKYSIKANQTIESVMNDSQFEEFSFPLKNKMNFYLGEKEIRNSDVIYFLKSIGGIEYFPITEEKSIQKDDKLFIFNLLNLKNEWIDLDEIIEELNKSKKLKKIDTYYVQNLDYHNSVVIMRHNKYEYGSSYIKMKNAT